MNSLRATYLDYVATFRQNGTLPLMMQLKLDHTEHVVSNAKHIMREEGWSGAKVQLGEAAALLHDAGRYEQLRRYGTFRDRNSCDHAALGVEVVRKQKWLDRLPEDERSLLLTAIAVHNKKEIPESIHDALTLDVCHLVRDADKLDIFRILEEAVKSGELERHPEIAWGLPVHAPPSKRVADAVCAGESVQYEWIESLSDFVLIQVGWLNGGLHFRPARELASARGHLEFRRNFLKKLSGSKEIDRCCDAAKSFI